MPPKGKGKKKGKKDLNKEKELEEQKRLAEEEARKEEERLKKEKEAKELRTRELIIQFFNQETTRLDLEQQEFNSYQQVHQSRLDFILENIQKEIDWEKYLECSILPSPKCERDLNTYLMLWAEEKLIFEDVPSLTPLYSQLPNGQILLKQLEFERGYCADFGDFKRYNNLHSYMITLYNILLKKWDETSQQFLQNLDMFSRESTENFQISMNLDQFSFGLWANLTRNPRHKQVEFLDTNMMCSLAKPLALDNVGIRMLYYYDTNCGIPYESQIGPHYSFIGGILHFDLMELPEQAKRVETWVMRPLLTTDGLIKKLEYPFKSAKEITDDGQEGIIDMSLWSTQISFAIQPNCYIDASAQIMYWDSELGSWSHEGIREEEFDAESGRIRFRSLKFAPTAIVQNTYLEFPIVDWVLEPYGLDTATLTIQGQKNQLKFLIGKGKVQVTNLTQHAIFNEPYPPSVLFKRLSQYGYNFIGPKSMNNVDLDWIIKHEKAEDACIVAISQYASIFQFKKSSLNGFLSTTKCSFQFIEPNDLMNQSSETPNNGYKTLIYDMDYNIQEKVVSISYLRSDSDTDDRHHNGFAPDGPTVESIQATSTVNALLKMNMKNSDNLQNVSPYFQETVLQVLRVSRLLCFS